MSTVDPSSRVHGAFGALGSVSAGRSAAGVAVTLFLAGLMLVWANVACAGEQGGEEQPARPVPRDIDHDPWQGFNRPVFRFNDGLDEYILEPVARGWDWIAPEPVKTGATNFFANLRLPNDMVYHLLQGKFEASAHAFGRFFVNSTLGMGGILDLTKNDGFERHEEDMGQTLAVWGTGSGPYLMLPVFGPSSPRDTTNLVADVSSILISLAVEPWVAATVWTGRLIHSRSRLLEEVRDAKETSLDYYTFVRNAYIQNRTAMINDSTAVAEEKEDDLYYFDDDF